MPLASIGGLASGLDTASIISQLMQVEAMPQTLLKGKISTEKTAVTALQGLNSKLAALMTKAQDLAKPGGWNPSKATSSYEHVTATADASAAVGKFSFTVVQTAEAHKLTFNNTALGTDRVTRNQSTFVKIDFKDGNVLDLDTKDGTLNGLVSAINEADAGLRAWTVKLDNGQLRLHVEATTTGKTSDFTLTNDKGQNILGGATVVAGRDAQIKIGPDTISSATNSFAGVQPGLDVTLKPEAVANTNVTVTVARDSEAAKTSVKALVDAMNAALTDLDNISKAGSSTTKAGPLSGDSTLRALRNELLATVTNAADGQTLATLGIELDKTGRLKLDEAKFDTAYKADPDAVTDRLLGYTPAGGTAVTGFLGRVEQVAKNASDKDTGSITAALKGRETRITDMQKAVDAWDIRLDLRRNALTRQFTALESALGQLQSQSSWLAGQINSLPQPSSS